MILLPRPPRGCSQPNLVEWTHWRRGGADSSAGAGDRRGGRGRAAARGRGARPVRVSDEVLVRVVAAGVNPIDRKTRLGKGVASAIPSFPAVLGLDFAGVVEEVPYAAHRCSPATASTAWPECRGSPAATPSSSGCHPSASRPCRPRPASSRPPGCRALRSPRGARSSTWRGPTTASGCSSTPAPGASATSPCSSRPTSARRSRRPARRKRGVPRMLGAHAVIDYAAERFEESLASRTS